ncbi:MAG: DUF421 domain-containing protein [Bacilli bacterium]|nr:DUF421 domain-containing protein [Bacilli bacterium]
MFKVKNYTHNNIGELMKYITISWRSFFFYILIGVLYRMMGKREVAELSIMDLLVSFFIAQLASIAIENYNQSILVSILPITILVVLQMISSKLELKSGKARKVIDGELSIIINQGKVNFKEMLKQRYNIEDLLGQLREQGIKSIEEVDYAILETDGKLSIFKKQDDPSSTFPLPIIVDGEIQNKTLIQLNKTVEWLEKELKIEDVIPEEVFYAFYQNKNLFIIKKSTISDN